MTDVVEDRDACGWDEGGELIDHCGEERGTGGAVRELEGHGGRGQGGGVDRERGWVVKLVEERTRVACDSPRNGSGI